MTPEQLDTKVLELYPTSVKMHSGKNSSPNGLARKCFIAGAEWAAANAWVNVEDRLPTPFKNEEGEYEYPYVPASDGTDIWLGMCQYDSHRGTWYMYGDFLSSTVKVTHWLDIKPPKI